MLKLDHQSSIPLRAHVEQLLRELVRLPKYQRGALLPDEVKLATRLGISRGTVRSGISKLVFEGVLERKAGVGTRRGDVQLVRGEDDRAPLVGAAPHRVDHEESVARIEVRGRLVEEEDLGLAGQDAREKDALAFAAAHRAEIGLGEREGVHLGERGFNGRAVSRRGRAERRAPRGAAQKDEIPGENREERLETLREIAERARRLAPRNPGQGATAETDGSAPRGHDARERLQERRLSRAVLAEQRGDAARVERARHVREDVARAVPRGERLGGERRGHGRALRSRRNAGAPRSAVMAPTEISAGAKSERAAISDTTRSRAPPMKERRSSARCERVTRRTACGTRRPTNPMIPAQ